MHLLQSGHDRKQPVTFFGILEAADNDISAMERDAVRAQLAHRGSKIDFTTDGRKEAGA
jgi:hypothetical protein